MQKGFFVEEVDFLLINPWIYDFSAFDFWFRPYGLLMLAGKLRKAGYKIHYLDLLDPFHPELPKLPKRGLYGTGHFYKAVVPKPTFFKDIPRRFFRYGIPFSLFLKEVSSISFKAVMLTCTLTYWYPGLFVLINYFANNFPQKPLYIGGIYSKLCEAHLKDFIQKNYCWLNYEIVHNDLDSFLKKLQERYEPSLPPYFNSYPAFDLQRRIPYVVIFTSEGCPFSCSYCASKRLYPHFKQKEPLDVVDEIVFWHDRYGVVDFAFYDDALLINFEGHFGIILESLIAKKFKLRLHAPGALHARFITKEVAYLLKRAGFVTIRLGLERVDDRLDEKVTLEEFLDAVENLKQVGFTSRELGAYILYGIPGENFEAVKRALLFLEKCSVLPYLAEFSPIPGTPLFDVAKICSRYPLEEEPLCQNNSAFPAFKNPPWELIQKVKDLAREIRAKMRC